VWRARAACARAACGRAAYARVAYVRVWLSLLKSPAVSLSKPNNKSAVGIIATMISLKIFLTNFTASGCLERVVAVALLRFIAPILGSKWYL